MGEKLSFELPNGGTITYDSDWNFKKVIEYVNKESKRYDLGLEIRTDVGVDSTTRAILGGDVYEAQEATLKSKFKYAQPIVSYVPSSKIDMPGSIENRRMLRSTKALEAIGLEPDPFLSQMDRIPEVNWIVQNEDGVVHIINEEGLTLGDLAALERPVLTEMGDIAGGLFGTFAATTAAGPAGALSTLARQVPAAATGSGFGGAITKEVFNKQMDQFGRVDPRSTKDRINSFIGETAIRGGTQLVGEVGAGVLRGGIKSALTMSPRAVLGGAGKESVAESKEVFGTPGFPSGVLAGRRVPPSDVPFEQVTQPSYGGFWKSFEGLLAKTPFANSAINNKMREMHTGFVNNIARTMGYDSSTTRKLTGEYLQKVTRGELQPLAEKGSVGDTYANGYLDVLKKSGVGVEFDKLRAQVSGQPIHQDAIARLRKLMTEASRHPVKSKLKGKSTHIGGYLADIEDVMLRSGPKSRKGAIKAKINDKTAIKREVADDIARQGGGGGFLGDIRKAMSEAEEIAFDRAGKDVPGFRDIKRKWYKGKQTFEESLKKIAEAPTPEKAWAVVRGWVRNGEATHLERLLDNNVKAAGEDGRKIIGRMILAEATHTPDMAQARTAKQMARVYQNVFKKETKDLLFPVGSAERKTLDRFFDILRHRFPDYEISKNPLFAAAMITGGAGGGIAGGVSFFSGGGNAWENMKSAMLGALIGTAAGGTTMGTLAYGTGKLITNDLFVDWLAKGVQTGPGGFGAHLAALGERAAMANDPYLEMAVGEYIQNVLAITASQEEQNKRGVVNVQGAMAPSNSMRIDPRGILAGGSR